MEISVKEARSRLSALLNRVRDGDEVVILRHGKEAARLVPPRRKRNRLPSLEDFRGTIRLSGESLSKSLIRARTQERY